MPSPISELSTFGERDAVRVVIETPAGSRVKFKFEPKSGVFTMHKALAQGFSYPFPFGFIPRTQGSDGDPLDVLLITTLEPPVGTVADTTIIGALLVEQAEDDEPPIRNDRFLAVPNLEHEDRPITDIAEMPAEELGDLEHFFVQSGERDGKHLRILGHANAEEALRLIKSSVS